MKCDYSGTSPLGHLYARDVSIQETQNLVTEKCSHNRCICNLFVRDIGLYSGERDTFTGSQNQDLTSTDGTP